MPRLPGSCSPASTTISGSVFFAAEQVRPTPLRRLDQRGNRLRGFCRQRLGQQLCGSSRISVSGGSGSASIRASAPWAAKTQATRKPARRASFNQVRPFDSGQAAGFRDRDEASARRSSLRRAFCLLCTMRTGIGEPSLSLADSKSVLPRSSRQRWRELRLAPRLVL